MATRYKQSSNYYTTNLNQKYLETYNPPLTTDTLSVRTRKTVISSKYNLRPDLMAYDLYGDSNVWWIFVHYNRDVIKDPVFDFKSGVEIVVPKTYLPAGY